MARIMNGDDDEAIIAIQRDERDSMAAIFAEDFIHLSLIPDHHAVDAVDDDDGHADERRGLEHGRRINTVVVPTSYAIRHVDQTSPSLSSPTADPLVYRLGGFMSTRDNLFTTAANTPKTCNT